MRIFKNKWFVRFARKENIGDGQLCDAIARAEKGLIDADLGGGLIKQRVSRRGEGRSGGYRTIAAYRAKSKAFFVYGFAKNERDNVDAMELSGFRRLAQVALGLADRDVDRLIQNKELEEVNCNGQDL